MLKEGSVVKVHLYDTLHREIKYNKYGETFEVRRGVGGKLGIGWSDTLLGPEKGFTPFSSFAPAAVFEEVSSGERYHYSPVTKQIEQECPV